MKTIIAINVHDFSNNVDKKIVVGKEVRWLQRGLNRWLTGTIQKIELEDNQKNENEATITVKLKSGKIMKTKAWQMLK